MHVMIFFYLFFCQSITKATKVYTINSNPRDRQKVKFSVIFHKL